MMMIIYNFIYVRLLQELSGHTD